MEQLQASDPAALCLMRRQITGHLHKFFCNRFNCADEDAEELTAEVLRRVHVSIGRFVFGGGAKLTTWIWKIARNLGIDYVRKQSRLASKNIATISLEEMRGKEFQQIYVRDWFRERSSRGTITIGSEEVEESAEHLPDNIGRMRRALDRLSEPERNVINMRLCMEYEEIAQVEHTSEGAIRVRHSRASERLRALFDEEAGL